MPPTSITIPNCAWKADTWRLGDLHLTPEGAFFFVFQPRPLPRLVPLGIFAAAFAVTVYVGMWWVWLTVAVAFLIIAVVKQVSLRRQREAWRATLAQVPLRESIAKAGHSWHVPPEKLARVELHLFGRGRSILRIEVVRKDEVKLTMVLGANKRSPTLRDEIAAVVEANGWSAALLLSGR
jgi:hypothetical protein